mgnify:CR=1 FL=1
MPLIETIAHDRIRELRLARPPVNALDPALCDELARAIETAVADGADGLVLSGGPKVFSAGLDVPYLLSVQDDRRVLRAAWDSFFNAAYALAACPVPVIAAIGVVIGLFQALTSVQEMTLTFVPKIGLMLVVFWVSMSFMTATLAGFFTDQILPQIAGS